MSRKDDVLKYFNKQSDFMERVATPNIERYRKGDASVKITDENGNALAGVKVNLRQKTHEFKYGANIFLLDELETSVKNDMYKQSFKDAFNLATIPFYWSTLEPVQGQPRYEASSCRIYRRPATDPCVEFCVKNGIEPKAHCLNYDKFVPDWLKDADIYTHKKMLEKRFSELAERYADVIPSWEVTNETFIDNAKYNTMFYNQDDFVEWSFKTADKYFPSNRLIINDYAVFDERWYRQNRSAYFMQIERLLRNGIMHLDSIGMQFHSFFDIETEAQRAATRYNPSFLYEVFDTYAKLGKSLQITEMTIPCYEDTADAQEVQAALIEKLYTVFFSHPAMEAVIYWNLVDGYAWTGADDDSLQGDMSAGENKYRGGLLNYDLSHKKAYTVIKDLFSKQWHTEKTCTTDVDGNISFRGFYGDYDLEISSNGKTVTKKIALSKYKNNVNEIKI